MAAARSWALAPIPAPRRTNHSGFSSGRTRSTTRSMKGQMSLLRRRAKMILDGATAYVRGPGSVYHGDAHALTRPFEDHD